MSFEHDPFDQPPHTASGERIRRQRHSRISGSEQHPRHRGVAHHPHSHQLDAVHGLHHPHGSATAQTDELQARVAGDRQSAQAGLRHSRLHLATRVGLQKIEAGSIQAYNAGTNTAMVRVLGSQANLIGPIPLAQEISPALAVAGASCLLVLLDEANPADGAIIAIYNAPPPFWLQAGSASLTLAGYQQAQTITFPLAFPNGIVAITVTSRHPDFVASVTNENTTGFIVTLTRREGATQVQAGTVNITVAAGASSGTATVSFPIAFAVTHTVVASSANGAWTVGVGIPSPTSCTMSLTSTSYAVTTQPAYNTPNPNTAATPVVQTISGTVGPAVGPATVTVYWQATGDPAVNSIVAVDWIAAGT